MISLFFAALFGSNSRNLDKTSNQQLFGYEQQPVNHQPPPPHHQHQQQYFVNNPTQIHQQPPPPNHVNNNSIINNNINNNIYQQPPLPPQSNSSSFKVSATPNNYNNPNEVYQQQSTIPTIVNQPQQYPVHNHRASISLMERPNIQPVNADNKPSAPTESFCNHNPSLNETINGNLNIVPSSENHYPPQQIPQPITIQQQQPIFQTPTSIASNQPPPPQPTVQTINMSIAGMPITIQKPLAQPVGQPNVQPVTMQMNATVSGNGLLAPSDNVDITKPFTPMTNTQVISRTPGYGQTLCYQQGYNNGIRVNQRVVQTGDQWSTEHEYGTYNVCFRISPTSGEHVNNPFSGLVLGVTGIANHKPPPGHTHFIVFNNVQQRIEKRAYPNDCRPAVPGGRYMVMESAIIPYNLIASFEVDCVGGRVNKQSLSCVICMLTNGHSIRVNQDEMDTVSLSAEKAKWLYQGLNYSLAMLKHKQQQQQQQPPPPQEASVPNL